MSKLKRSVHKGMKGPDVLAVKRALKKAGYRTGIVLNQKFGGALDRQVRRFQQNSGLLADGVYGETTHAHLAVWFDAYGLSLLAAAPAPDPKAEAFARLLSYMDLMTKLTPGYMWGGGHGVPIKDVRPDQKLDCSSSTSRALYEVDMFPGRTSWVSGDFEGYGNPGPGEYFTVYANTDHVWIRLHKGPYWRFDTSPHGDGGRGPRLRKLPRFTSGFVARHWPRY